MQKWTTVPFKLSKNASLCAKNAKKSMKNATKLESEKGRETNTSKSTLDGPSGENGCPIGGPRPSKGTPKRSPKC